MFVWAALYFEARAIAYDSSWRNLELIQTGAAKISHSRYLLIAIQWLPLLVLKLGGSLKAILLAHSISWVLFSYAVYVVLIHVMKELGGGILLILSLVLATGSTFFYMAAELPHSLTVFALFVGCLNKLNRNLTEKRKIFWFIACCLLVIIASYGQLLIGIVFLWFLGFEYVQKKQWRDPILLGLIGFVIAWIGFRFFTISANSYTSSRITDIAAFSFTDMFSIDSIYFGGWLIKVKKGLWVSLLIAGILVANYVRRRHYLLGLFVGASLLGYVIVGIILSGQGILASDHYLMIWGGMISWPFLLTIGKIRKQTIAVATIALVILIGTHYLHQKRSHFVKHFSYISQLLVEFEQQQSPKTLILSKDLDYNYIWTPGYLGPESLLISALEDPKESATIFAADDLEKFQTALTDSSLWLGPSFAPFSYQSTALKNMYFQLPERIYLKLTPHR